jgi:hypothetical protein
VFTHFHREDHARMGEARIHLHFDGLELK